MTVKCKHCGGINVFVKGEDNTYCYICGGKFQAEDNWMKEAYETFKKEQQKVCVCGFDIDKGWGSYKTCNYCNGKQKKVCVHGFEEDDMYKCLQCQSPTIDSMDTPEDSMVLPPDASGFQSLSDEIEVVGFRTKIEFKDKDGNIKMVSATRGEDGVKAKKVKEAVKKLKEVLCRYSEDDPGEAFIDKKINQIFGEKLTKW